MIKIQTYTTAEVVRLFQRVDVLTRENGSLQERLRQCEAANDELARINSDYTSRLADLEGYYARQRTEARIIPLK